ncbi:hypothetical protein MSPP1_002085 [Malassezia sp. CBS 17886]|nr:hypothetical protein MSPP1_002085 [Malassezia sp. CBS 17886]
MDLYLTTFRLQHAAPPPTPMPDGAPHSADAFEPRSEPSMGAFSAHLLDASAGAPSPPLQGVDRAPSPQRASADLVDAVHRIGAKAMAAHQCAVSVVARQEGCVRGAGTFSAAPGSAPYAPGASPNGPHADTSSDGSPAPPAPPSTEFSFHLRGTQTQALDARGTLLQEVPFLFQLSLRAPRSDVAGGAGSTSAPGSGVLKSDVRAQLDRIMAHTSTAISVSHLEARGPGVGGGLETDRSVQISVVGPMEAIECARTQVLVLLDELNALHVDRVEIEPKLLHASAGRKRSTIQLIEGETNTNVYLSTPFAGVLGGSTQPRPPHTVHITGAFRDVQRAKDMLVQVASAKGKTLLSRQVALMPRKVDWLLRERLEALRACMLDNSTYLELPVIGSQHGQVTVFGTSRVDVERSIRTLMQLVAPFCIAHVWLLSGSFDALGLSGKADVRSLATLVAETNTASGAEVAFTSNAFEIAGCNGEVRAAVRHLVQAPALSHYTLEYRFQLELATEHREFISGKKNGKINKIMEQCGARIRFEPFNEYNFLIDVLATDLDAALQGLSLLQEELPAEISFHVPEAYHKRIIGVGGKNIQRIMKKYGVYVKFSNAEEFAALGGYIDNDDNVIARTPSKNAPNLEHLKSSVMELVSPKDKDFVTDAVPVPRRHHRTLLGARASHVHEIERKTRCVLRFARKESAQDTVYVFGPESQVAVAAQMLQQHVPHEAELRVPGSYELSTLLDAPDYALLVDRMHKELGVSLAVAARAPGPHGECLFRFQVPRAGMEMLPVAKAMLDELCAARKVPMQAPAHVPSPSDTRAAPAPVLSPAGSAAPGAAPATPFSAVLLSPPHSAAPTDTFSTTDTFPTDTSATAVSPVPAGAPRYEDAPASAPAAPPAADLKALFEQPGAPRAMGAEQPSTNTPLMSSFYTPAYAEGAGLSHPVWGSPLPSVPDMDNTTKSVFSPFSSSAIPFQFAPDAPRGPDSARGSGAFAAPPPNRRPVTLASRAPGGDRPAYSPHALGPPPPPGLHAPGDIGNDIDGFRPLSDGAPRAGPGRMGAADHVPSARGVGRPHEGVPHFPRAADSMDEVSRVLAQIAFDQQ